MTSSRDFRFLIIGLGSMGRRRIRALLANKVPRETIFGYNITAKRAKEVGKEYAIKTTANFNGALKEFKPNVFIISTPPDQHKKYFLYAAKHNIHFFMEHPITDAGYKELFKYLNKKSVVAPSCTFRYHPAVIKLRELVNAKKIGKLLTFQYHLGQYLPDWHVYEDYRDVYFSKKATGACREMYTFELVWLTDLLKTGPKEVTGITDKVSDLDMSADDIYASVMRFNNGIIGTVVIDLLSRKAFRTLRLIGTKGVIEWEWQEDRIRLFDAKTKKWKAINLKRGRSEKGYVTTEDMYEEEIKVFLDSIAGKRKYPFTIKENHKYLQALYALEKDSKAGQTLIH